MTAAETYRLRAHGGERDSFSISTDPVRLDVEVIHAYLAQSYWAKGIPREILRPDVYRAS